MSEDAVYRVRCGYDGPELVELRIESCGTGRVVYDCAVVSGVVPFAAVQKLLHAVTSGGRVICGADYQVEEEDKLG